MLSSFLLGSLAISPSPDVGEEMMHVLIVALSSILVVIAALAYSRKRNRRYLFLSMAFVFLLLSQLVTMLEVVLFSNSLLMIPVLNLHITHLFDLLMLVSFAAALMRDWAATPVVRDARTHTLQR